MIATAVMTVNEAVEIYKQYKQDKIGLPNEHGIRQNSYNTLCAHLKAIMSTIDDDQPMQLTKRYIEHLCDTWLRRVSTKELTYRTATAYLLTFKAFLNWCDYEDDIPYEHPHAIDRCFRFKNTAKPKILDYDPQLIQRILATLNHRAQTYVLMALHCGYYPVDITRLRPEMIKIVNGEHYIVRVRERISHVCDVDTWHWIPEELYTRMEKHKAITHGNYFTNQNGNELQTIANTRTCNISTNYARGCRLIGVNLPFKQFRKIGATWIATHYGESASRMYRASQLGVIDRAYIKDDFIAKLTPSLKSWHNQMAIDGLYGVSPKLDGRKVR